jgi:hypothetical protein
MVYGERRRSYLVACVERERGREGSAEGASEQGEVGEWGAGLKRGEDVRRWPENARSWARPRRGMWAGGWGRTDRWARQDREREAGARAKGTAPIGLAHWAVRGREGARRLAPTGETRLSRTEGARGWA